MYAEAYLEPSPTSMVGLLYENLKLLLFGSQVRPQKDFNCKSLAYEGIM